MFFSTRNRSLCKSASEALLDGLASDGGLYYPVAFPQVKVESLLDSSYPEIVKKVLVPYLDDLDKEEVYKAIDSAYDKNHFEEKILDVTTFQNLSFLELFHGATLTFKDMALSLLPYLFKLAKEKHPERKEVKILTATSGDTGSAVLSSFALAEDIKVSIFYPDKGIAPIQEKQMLYFTSSKARAYALKESNFDTCQSLVKKMLLVGEKEGYTSANSINIGRLLPQIAYYYYAYITLVKRGEIKVGDRIDVIVPTGNFGDILASYFAKRMSLPLGKLILASDKNRVLTDFFNTGIYDLNNRPFYKTISPSMDILISSNLERLLYAESEDSTLVKKWMDDLKEKGKFEVPSNILSKLKVDFEAYCGNEEETKEAIRSSYQENHYLLDPHTAVAYACYQKRNKKEKKTLLVATASPLKFPETELEALDIPVDSKKDPLSTLLKKTKLPLPRALKKVLNEKTEPYRLSPEEAERVVFSKKRFVVKVPATSANLGSGFDCLGIALSLFDTFSFEESSKKELLNFPDLKGGENLVKKAYDAVFDYVGLSPIPCSIKELDNQIPLSHGLGSSSASIVAGLLGANEMLNRKLSKRELYELACQLEGHPDNAGACIYGDLVLNVKEEEKGVYSPYRFDVDRNIGVLVLIPEESVSTSLARASLPSAYPRSSLTFDASRTPLVTLGLKEGNLSYLEEGIQDVIHVPYRKKNIEEYSLFESLFKEEHLPFTISGSGSTMIGFYDKRKEKELAPFFEKIKTVKKKTTRLVFVEVVKKGATSERREEV